MPLQDPAGDVAHLVFVLDQQDRLGAPQVLCVRCFRGSATAASTRGRWTSNVVPAPRSLSTQTCPPLCCTIPKTVQAEPRPLAHLLRREERLEDPGERRLVHPHAGVRDREHHERPGLDPDVTACVLLVERDVRRLRT